MLSKEDILKKFEKLLGEMTFGFSSLGVISAKENLVECCLGLNGRIGGIGLRADKQVNFLGGAEKFSEKYNSASGINTFINEENDLIFKPFALGINGDLIDGEEANWSDLLGSDVSNELCESLANEFNKLILEKIITLNKVLLNLEKIGVSQAVQDLLTGKPFESEVFNNVSDLCFLVEPLLKFVTNLVTSPSVDVPKMMILSSDQLLLNVDLCNVEKISDSITMEASLTLEVLFNAENKKVDVTQVDSILIYIAECNEYNQLLTSSYKNWLAETEAEILISEILDVSLFEKWLSQLVGEEALLNKIAEKIFV